VGITRRRSGSPATRPKKIKSHATLVVVQKIRVLQEGSVIYLDAMGNLEVNEKVPVSHILNISTQVFN
jgi:hypothetical protein